MKTTRQMTIKPSLLNDIIALPHKDARQINIKINQLVQDPMPDGKTKKHLKHIAGKFYRLRCGDYRVIYTYNEHSLGILAIRRRMSLSRRSTLRHRLRMKKPRRY